MTGCAMWLARIKCRLYSSTNVVSHVHMFARGQVCSRFMWLSVRESGDMADFRNRPEITLQELFLVPAIAKQFAGIVKNNFLTIP